MATAKGEVLTAHGIRFSLYINQYSCATIKRAIAKRQGSKSALEAEEESGPRPHALAALACMFDACMFDAQSGPP